MGDFTADWDDLTTKFTLVKSNPSRKFYKQTIHNVWTGEATQGVFKVFLYYDFSDLEGVAQNDQDQGIMHDEVVKFGFTWHPDEDESD